MDFLGGHDRKFSEDDDENPGLASDVLSSDGDSFTTSMGMDTFGMEDAVEGPGDWFHSVFGEHSLVYNDRNLGETASHQPTIKAEHSYSVCNLGPASPTSPSPLPLNLIKMEDDHSCGMALDLTHKDVLTQPSSSSTTNTSHHAHFRLDTLDPADHFLVTSHAPSTLTSTLTLTRSANILLTSAACASPATSTTMTRRHRLGQAAYGSKTPTAYPYTDERATNMQIKTEPLDSYEERTVNMDSVILPPTPPSSNGSDSEGSQSPQCSAPSSPQRQSPLRVYHYHSYTQHHDTASSSDDCLSAALSQPLFLSPVPQSGVLILTEEEKRTLISEGYPVPCRLPLTKGEEKNLKKVRRKIKNKISAQESRRKKKEYVEALEKRMEVYSHENSDLRKKVDCLESSNRNLLSQLHRLQALVAKLPKGANSSDTTTTSTTSTTDYNKPGLVLT